MDTIPVHSLPQTPGKIPSLKIYRFKNSTGIQRNLPENLPTTPLPTDAPHRHNYYEILFIEEGQGFHEIDFHSHPFLGAGLHFLTPGQVHLLHFTTHCKGVIVAFSEEFYTFYNTATPALTQLPFFQPKRRQPILSLSDSEKNYFHNLLENMVSDHIDQTGDPTMTGKYLGLLIQKCGLMAKTHQSNASLNSSVPELVGLFQEMVEKNFLKMHEVQQYATELAVTPDYLSKVVKKYLGTSCQEYILDKLLLEAKRLLVFTNLSGKEIAYHIHIDDPSYFGRIFKRKTGLTPNEYRDQVRKSAI